MASSQQHRDLVFQASKWVKRQGFSVVRNEISSLGNRERPDVIGFRSSCSILIEVKVSLADFKADFIKPERLNPSLGIGTYRFYFTPPGLIKIEDIPPGWGLIYCDGKKVEEKLKPLGNMWPSYGSANSDWSRFQHVSCAQKERDMLFSIARRMVKEKSSR